MWLAISFPRISHGNRSLSSAQRSALFLITRMYKATSTEALQVLTEIPPLDSQLQTEAELLQVTRLGMSKENNLSYFNSPKVMKNSFYPASELIKLLPKEVFNGGITIFIGDLKYLMECVQQYCCYRENVLINTWKSRLRSRNSVYLEELLTIKEAIQ